MIADIALCMPPSAACTEIKTMCEEYFARRGRTCRIEVFSTSSALLQSETAPHARLIVLAAGRRSRASGIAAGVTLRERGYTGSIVFVADTPAHAYAAYEVWALQYLLVPVPREKLDAVLDAAFAAASVERIAVPTARGAQFLTFSAIEYVECTDHVLHFHCEDGSVVRSVSQRVPLAASVAPLLADARFVQPHRSFVVNLESVTGLCDGELRLHSGAHIPLPRARIPALQKACEAYFRPKK